MMNGCEPRYGGSNHASLRRGDRAMNATEDLPLKLFEGTVGAAERVVKVWDENPPEGPTDRPATLDQQYGAEALVAHCLRLARDSRQLWDSTWARAEAGH